MGLLGRIAALRLGRPDSRVQYPVTTFPDSQQRLLIAPVNYSGQAREWARALEQRVPSIAVRNMAIDVPGGFDFPADLVVPVAVYQNDRRWQQRQFLAARTATHVLVEAEEPPFGRLLGRDVGRQVDALLKSDVSVAFMCHGTDIRLPSRHISATPWSTYREPSVYVPRLESLAKRHKELLDRFGLPVFVSTPDLLADVPAATWCPVVVNPEQWSSPRSETVPPDRPLRVAHTPSVSALKGTNLILPILEKLQDEGIIQFRLVTGVHSAQMPAVFADADIVLDQFRAGSYGVAACEAMASGCLVIGHVIDEVRQSVEDFAGHRLPIVEATPDTLERVLRRLASERTLVKTIGEKSQDFIRNVHDGRLSASVLMSKWLDENRL